MKVLLVLAVVCVGIAIAQIPGVVPEPADFPGLGLYGFPQNAGGPQSLPNGDPKVGPFEDQPSLGSFPTFGTAYGGGLGGAFPNQYIGGIDPVRDTVPNKGRGASTGHAGRRSGYGATSGGAGFAIFETKNPARVNLNDDEFIEGNNVPGASASALVPAVAIALVSLFFF
eukprot:TRINITY_DN16810_c0_g1_i1.p2 TRINITY_DN16810_c0_g1~~TRINITY_DN16810_c0_g1_i1.p2  ORF type:complete len:170 (+),score=78.77 TRINITY_DN16810_c0_g1_i1:77-586(+)